MMKIYKDMKAITQLTGLFILLLVVMYPPAMGQTAETYYYSADQAAELQAHFLVANDGDIFILSSGGEKYILDGIPDVNEKITIMAAPDLEQRPILTNGVATTFRPILNIIEGGGLILKDIEFDAYSADGAQQMAFAIRVPAENSINYHIVAENCYFHDFQQNFIRIDRATHADSLVFNNCVFENTSAHDGIRFSNQPSGDLPNPTFDLLKITNSTFANVSQHGIYVQWNAGYTSGPVIIDQVTMNNIGAANRNILRFTAVESISITNSIFTNSIPTQALNLNSDATTFDYCNLYNLADQTAYGGVNMLALDPMYQDAGNLDFTVLNTELWATGDQGQFMGDPRWEPFRAIATAQAVNNDAGESVVVQSNKAPGHLFMILQGEVQTTLDDFNSAVAANKGATAEVTKAYSDVSLSTEGLEPGLYNLYAVDSNGIISAPVEGIFTVTLFVLEATASSQSATNETGQSVVAQSNKAPGHLFMILQGEVQTTLDDFNAAVAANKGATAEVTEANVDVSLSTEGLEPGLYNLYAVDGAQNISTPVDGVFSVTEIPVEATAVSQTVTNGTGEFVVAQSNKESGHLFIVLQGEAQTSLAELNAAVSAGIGSSAVVTAADTDTNISTEEIQTGTYNVYAVDANENLSAPLEGFITVNRVPVVVMALTQVATNEAGQTVAVQSNYADGKVYIIKAGEAHATVADLDAAIAAAKGASASVTAADTDMLIDVEDLEGGTYTAFAVDGEDNISEPGENAITISDVTITDDIIDEGVLSGIYSANATIYIDWGLHLAKNTTVEFYNLLGSKIHSSVLLEGQNKFEFSNEEILIIRILSDGKVFTKKVLIR